MILFQGGPANGQFLKVEEPIPHVCYLSDLDNDKFLIYNLHLVPEGEKHYPVYVREGLILDLK